MKVRKCRGTLTLTLSLGYEGNYLCIFKMSFGISIKSPFQELKKKEK